MERSLNPPSSRWQRLTAHLTRPRLLRTAVAVVTCAILITVLAVRFADANRTVTRAPGGTLIGRTAPDFQIAVWNGTPGQTIQPSALRGRPVVINFWATWCQPCQDEAPLLAAAWQRDHTRLTFVGVAFDTPAADALQFISRYGITYPCGPGDGATLATAYGLPGLPATIFIDRRGIVVRKVTGQLTASTLDQGLATLLGAGR